LKALILEDKRILRILELDTPILKDGEVLVDVEVAGIGGSEYLGFNDPGIRSLPNIMGHGITGLTSDGRRVAVNPLQGCSKCAQCTEGLIQLCDSWSLIGVHSNGGFAQQVSVPEDSLYELLDLTTWEQSAFIEPFANSINAWELSKAEVNHTVAIIGAGGLGMGLVACVAGIGCKVIEVSDISESRRLAAKTLGATKAVESLEGEFDVVFDTVGSIEARKMAIQLTKKNGKCIFLGFAAQVHEVNFSELIRQQKHFIGSFVYSKQQFKKAIELAQCTQNEWVKNLSFYEVEPQLRKYLEGAIGAIPKLIQ